MAVSLLPWLDQFFTDSNGNPLTGGSVETYAAGTSTPKSTWSDPAGTILNANPVPLNSAGRPTSGGIYGTIGEAYKIVVKDSLGVVQQCSRDNVLFPSNTSGGATGDFLDKVTTSPQGVAGAVTWDSLQTHMKGLNIYGADAGGWAMKIPDNSWIRPQTPNQALYLTNGTTPSSINSVLHLDVANTYLGAGNGTNRLSWLTLNSGYVTLRASNGIDLDALYLGNDDIVLSPHGGGNLTLGGGSGLQWAKNGGLLNIGDPTLGQANAYSNSVGHTFSGGPLTIPLPAGTPTQLVGWDGTGKLVQAGTAPAGGFVALSGHNDAGTTPWSIGDAASWASVTAGYWFDPIGTYQNWLKGNLLIDQGVSNVATLYRQSFSVGQTICLMFDGQNSVGTQTRYAETCGQIATNTAGAHDGEWYTKIAIGGTMTDRIRATVAGGNLYGKWLGNGSGYGMGTTILDVGYLKCSPKFAVDATSGTAPVYQVEVDGTKVYHNYNLFYSGGFQAKVASMPSAQTYWDSATGAFVWFSAPAGSPASLTQLLALSIDGKLSTRAAIAGSAGFNLPTGVVVTSPVTGDVWSPAADSMKWRSGANTRSFGLLEVAQTWSAVQTFSSTPVISSTTASTTAGAIYKRTGYGHVGYEAGMAQEFNSTIYTGPVGAALTNSVTETDVTGGTAQFGTRTTSTSVMQNGVRLRVQTTASFLNSAANTLTLRIKYGATTVATITITSVVASATPIDIWCQGVATAAPGAAVETVWTCGVEGSTSVVAATAVGTIQNLATSTASAISMTAQWTTALATSTYQTKATEIILQ